MNEPLPGQKTTIVAAVFTVLQALAAAGFVAPETAHLGGQVAGGVFALTLLLKALRARAAKKG